MMKCAINKNREVNNMKPTREEYEEALNTKETFARWISLEAKRRDELLDQLCDVVDNIKLYKVQYNKADEVVMKYELYEQIEKERK